MKSQKEGSRVTRWSSLKGKTIKDIRHTDVGLDTNTRVLFTDGSFVDLIACIVFEDGSTCLAIDVPTKD